MSYDTKVYHKQGGGELVIAANGKLNSESGSIVTGLMLNLRMRSTVAEVNAGKTLLPALPGYKYRMVDCAAIAIGGAASAVTTVDILGTQTSAVKLVAFAQAQLTQSSVLYPGITGAAVLADGASFVSCDANTAITIGKTGSSVATSTHIDVVLSYVIEVA